MKMEKVIVSPKTTVLETIKVIDQGGMQIALVVDTDRKLLGTVTDGDVRRGILNGVSLEEPVEKLMNRRPTTATDSDNRESLFSIMNQGKFHQIPLIDSQGHLIGLEVLEDLIRPKKIPNPAILMAGGAGKRLRPFTDHIPKPLLRLGNRPILETILTNLISHGFTKFYVSVNYKGHMIEDHFGDGSKWGVEIEYLKENEPLGTAGCLNLLPEKPQVPFLVMNGDLLTKVNFQQLLLFHEQNKVDATMCVGEYESQVPYGVVKTMNKEGEISVVDEKPVQRHFVNAGIYIMEPKILELIPGKGYLDMPSLFNQIIQGKGKAVAFPIREYWLDIGRMQDFERAQSEFPEVFDEKSV